MRLITPTPTKTTSAFRVCFFKSSVKIIILELQIIIFRNCLQTKEQEIINTLIVLEIVPDTEILSKITRYGEKDINSTLETLKSEGCLYDTIRIEGKYELNEEAFSSFYKKMDEKDRFC